MGVLKKIFKKKAQNTLLEDIRLTKDWIALALNSSGYTADFSLESLKEIDRFFEEENRPDGLLSQDRGRRLWSIGVYVGEVLITCYGGEWLTDDNDPQGELNMAVKFDNGGMVWPVQKIMKRLMNGSEDSIYSYGRALATCVNE